MNGGGENMTRQEWDKLAEENIYKYLELYNKFMFNSHNYMCCTVCPANTDGGHTYENMLPCEEYCCLVLCYCYQL